MVERERAAAGDQGAGQREDHDQSRLRRSRPGRPARPEGFYSNRTDFIRTAIRHQLERHGEAARESVRRRQLQLGLCHFSAHDLEAARAAGEVLDIRVLGLATIASDVTPELARAAIGSLTVLGALHADPAVKAALADRIA